MPVNDNPRATYEKELGRLEKAAGTDISQDDAEAIERFVRAHDSEDLRVNDVDVESKAARTLKRYSTSLRLVAKRLDEYDTTLLEADATDINRLMEAYRNGDHPDVKDGGMTVNSVANKQGTVRKFLRFSDSATADGDEIPMYDREDTKVDERDVLDSNDIEACRQAISTPRNRALFELMLNTGQRVRAVQTLRIKDLDFEEGASGVFWLNEDAAGLKGAEGKRPMLGAHEAIRDYVRNYHPCPNDLEAAVFTGLPEYTPELNYGDELHHTAILRAIKKIGKEAGIERLHPHLLRHTAVTIMHRDYDIDESHIKYIIGHSEDSTVMETTYSHLKDDDHVKAIEVGGGYREPDNEKPLTPGNCPVCDAQLEPNDAACSRCGFAFSPDAVTTKEQINQQVKESYKQTDPEDTETMGKLDQLDDLLEDPEVKAALLEKLGEE